MRMLYATRLPAPDPRPGTNRHADLLGVADEVPDDQEVPGELHVDDDPQLALESLAVDVLLELAAQRTLLGQALVEPAPRHLAQVRDLVLDAFGQAKVGQLRTPELELDVAHACDPGGVLHRLGVLREVAPHLLRGLDEELLGLVVQALVVAHRATHAHAHQHLVGVGLGLIDVVAVVGRDDRHAEIAAELRERGVDLLLQLHAVGLQLQKILPRLEDVGVLAHALARSVHVAGADEPRDVPTEAGREPDQALAVLAQHLSVDAGVVIKAVQMPVADQTLQVLVADRVLGQQHDVVVLAIALGRRVTIREVGLAAEDRLDAVVLGRLVELDGPEHVAVVGHGDGLHAACLDLGAQVVHADRTIEQRVLRVQVQMREVVDAGDVAGLVGGHARRVNFF
jgi:hypothetical protein